MPLLTPKSLTSTSLLLAIKYIYTISNLLIKYIFINTIKAVSAIK